MADLTPVIETLENRWMRAWVQRDQRALKALTASDFILLAASKPPQILDRPSWLEAAGKRYRCSSYQFGDLYVRDWGGVAMFAARLDVQATLDDRDLSGSYWVSDLWRKGRVRRRWRLVQRILSRGDDEPQLRAAVKALQLWR